jgi:hypothetical protein
MAENTYGYAKSTVQALNCFYPLTITQVALCTGIKQKLEHYLPSFARLYARQQGGLSTMNRYRQVKS